MQDVQSTQDEETARLVAREQRLRATAPGTARFQRRRTDVPPEVLRPVVHINVDAETKARTAVVRRSLVAADLVAASASVAAITVAAGTGGVRPLALFAGLVVVLAAKLSGLYDRDEVRLRKSTLEEVPALFQLSGLSALVLWLADGLVFVDPPGRGAVLGLWALMLATMTIGRMAARRVAATRTPAERCLIVGDPAAHVDVAERIGLRGAEVIGFLPLVERRRPRPGEALSDPADALEDLVRRTGAHRIIVVPGPHAEADVTLACVSRAQELGTYVSILPRMLEVVGSSVEFDHVDGMTLLGVHPFGLSRSSRRLKRAVDVVGAVAALVLAAPVFVVAAIAIRLDSRGPVFFRQPRVGHAGQPFEMLKFRSMYEDADRVRAELAAVSHAGDGLFKVPGDPRVTPVGRVLRRFSIDELPQILNVLRGDMSLVGPRPLIVSEDRNIAGRHRRRLQLTPGMTGPWQVLGTAHRRVPLRDMVTLDYLYAGNWSLWTDVKILLRTIVHVVRGRGL